MTQMWIEILQQPEALKNCINTNKEKIKTLVEFLKNKVIRHIIISGRGTSWHSGIYFKYLMEVKAGIPVSFAAPSVATLYNGKVNMEGALVIGISQSGRAADVLEVLKSAKAQGVPTIAITNYEDSPMATEADHHLFCAAGEEKSVATTKTFTSTLYLLANLAAEWTGDEDFKKELAAVPELVQKVIDNNEQIKNTVLRYRFMSECYVLGRGMNYSITLETALKLMETTYVRARGFAISDFYHGPFAVVDKHLPVFVFAPEGESKKDAVEMINKLKDAGADVLAVTNSSEIKALADSSIDIPEGVSDFISPFVNAVTGQMFACNLSVLRGLNPDNPRGLKKVTVTR